VPATNREIEQMETQRTLCETFSAADTFAWSGDWYVMPGNDKDALVRRNARAAELKRAGLKVKCGTHGVQLLSRGGIGSGHPHIEVLVKVYELVAVSL
jgi:hypothetical protein